MKVLLAAAQIWHFSTKYTMPTYSLDTSIASYLLNGELWKRTHLSLLQEKLTIYLKHGKDDAPAHESKLEKSKKAYEWSSLHSHHVHLVMPPTVTLELARAPQVSIMLCVYRYLAR